MLSELASVAQVVCVTSLLNVAVSVCRQFTLSVGILFQTSKNFVLRIFSREFSISLHQSQIILHHTCHSRQSRSPRMSAWDLPSTLKEIKSSIDKLLCSSKTFSLDGFDELRQKDPDRADALLTACLGSLSERRQKNVSDAAKLLNSGGAATKHVGKGKDKEKRDIEAERNKQRDRERRQRELNNQRQKEEERRQAERRHAERRHAERRHAERREAERRELERKERKRKW